MKGERMKPEPEPKDDVMNVEEVAELLKVKPKTVWKWKKDRGLPFLKIGTATRYMRSDVMAWVASHKQRQGPGNE